MKQRYFGDEPIVEEHRDNFLDEGRRWAECQRISPDLGTVHFGELWCFDIDD